MCWAVVKAMEQPLMTTGRRGSVTGVHILHRISYDIYIRCEARKSSETNTSRRLCKTVSTNLSKGSRGEQMLSRFDENIMPRVAAMEIEFWRG